MRVITGLQPFIDIDGFASMVAYAELLRLQGEQAVAASNSRFNASIPPMARSLDVQFDHNYKPTQDDTFTLVDLADPSVADGMVVPNRITEVIDHRPGNDSFWADKPHVKVQVELVGSAATLIFERWQTAKLLDKMSKGSAILLSCAILDNTLNLGAAITSDRDHDAYAWLTKHAGLQDDFAKDYFVACQNLVLQNIRKALPDDSKAFQYPSLPQKTHVGQLALWNAQEFMQTNKDIIRMILAAEQLPWYMNLIDIHAGRSIFYCEDDTIRGWLTKTLDVTFEGDTATADRMWLRKEIMKQAIERSER